MTGVGSLWPVRLAEAAQTDFSDIVRWTAEHFGDVQAALYADIISAALKSLTEGPTVRGVRPRDDILPGLRTLHVAPGRRKGRHFVTFRVTNVEGQDTADVLRILHDAMDRALHL